MFSWIIFGLIALRLVQVLAECGTVQPSDRIVGGTETSNLYPWFVALTVPSRAVDDTLIVGCGGSLITNKYILTAAHCYASAPYENRPTLYQLVYLLQDRCNVSYPSILHGPQAKTVEIHENYSPTELRNDIALITLRSNANYGTVCLPQPGYEPRGDGLVIGFGSLILKAYDSSRYPCHIQQATLPIISRNACLRTGMEPYVKNLRGIICAGLQNGGVDTCDGDSGGPLLTVNANGRYTIQGITSFGNGCARKNFPGVYTEVSYFTRWIRKRIFDKRGSGFQNIEMTKLPRPANAGGGIGGGILPPVQWPTYSVAYSGSSPLFSGFTHKRKKNS